MELSIAASALRALQGQERQKLSGMVNGVRVRRGAKAILADGRMAEIIGARGGNVVVRIRDPRLLSGQSLLVAHQHEVTVVKHACAVALGHAKLGVAVKKSHRKLLSSRENGRRPARPGRKRGRPPGSSVRASRLPDAQHIAIPQAAGFEALISYYNARPDHIGGA